MPDIQFAHVTGTHPTRHAVTEIVERAHVADSAKGLRARGFEVAVRHVGAAIPPLVPRHQRIAPVARRLTLRCPGAGGPPERRDEAARLIEIAADNLVRRWPGAFELDAGDRPVPVSGPGIGDKADLYCALVRALRRGVRYTVGADGIPSIEETP